MSFTAQKDVWLLVDLIVNCFMDLFNSDIYILGIVPKQRFASLSRNALSTFTQTNISSWELTASVQPL